MSTLIENKNRIIDLFNRIKVAILGKNVQVGDNVRTYPDAIRLIDTSSQVSIDIINKLSTTSNVFPSDDKYFEINDSLVTCVKKCTIIVTSEVSRHGVASGSSDRYFILNNSTITNASAQVTGVNFVSGKQYLLHLNVGDVFRAYTTSSASTVSDITKAAAQGRTTVYIVANKE